MNEQQAACRPERLRLLLEGELPPEVESQVTEHLVECPACRAELESLAGGRDWWTELRDSLHEAGTPNKMPIGSAPNGTGTGPGFDASMESGIDTGSFEADFAVEFLDPCERPDAIGRINDIEILEVIGRGGMGIVLKGFQRELGRYVAVKVMSPHLAVSGSARQRFAREARAAAAIVHPQVMPIHSVHASSRLPYLVMPYVDCESLQQRIDRSGPLELKEILRIGLQVAAGLAAAHAQGLVHRDVKPANILLERGVDRVMLTDFGLARTVDDASLTRTGVIAGTPQFMSPEQARGDPVDTRSDLFSLGSVLYTMATGHPPFRAETALGVLRRITDTEPRTIREINPDLPPWLDAVVHRLHAKEPDQRYESAAEVARLLESCLSHVQQPTTFPLPESLAQEVEPMTGVRRGFFQASRHWTVRRRVIARAAVALLVLLAIVAVVAFRFRPGSHRATVDADHRPTGGQPSPKHPSPTTTLRDERPSTPTDARSPSLDWNDGADELLERLDVDSRRLQQRAERFWDGSQSFSTTPAGRDAVDTHSSLQESTP